jgi:hypothetical protein
MKSCVRRTGKIGGERYVKMSRRRWGGSRYKQFLRTFRFVSQSSLTNNFVFETGRMGPKELVEFDCQHGNLPLPLCENTLTTKRRVRPPRKSRDERSLNCE